MRIDQLLWCLRYYKSRAQANQACRKGAVKINDQTVKPSREVIPTDRVAVRKNQLWYRFTLLDVPKTRMAAKLVDIYRMDTTPSNALTHQEMQDQAWVKGRDKGLGRPTKKDRRAMDDFQEESTQAPEPPTEE